MSVETYFLGANSAKGFCSLYSDLCPPQNQNFLWVIKGGPGCGKSSFMRKIGKAAEEKGYDTEYILCSGDPASLDGVYIPQLQLGYVDGTAPHTLDVPYPGAHGLYLDLGQFYNRSALQERAAEIKEVNTQYKALYKKAYALLSAVPGTAPISPAVTCRKRFHTAVSCSGIVTVDSGRREKHIGTLELHHTLTSAKPDDIAYMHPLWPDTIMSFYSAEDKILYHAPIPVPACESAVFFLKTAKQLHDELERIYNPNVDFDGVYNLALQHIQNYL